MIIRTVLKACICIVALHGSALANTQLPVCDSAAVLESLHTAGHKSCEAPAPYTLKIIKSGETKPRNSNETAIGRQDNRRVDVTVARKVANDAVGARSVDLTSGGTVWVTRDPSVLDRDLRIETAKNVTVENGQLVSPVKFNLYSNYGAFIQRYEIRIYEAGSEQSTKPLHILQGQALGLKDSVSWDGQLPEISQARRSLKSALQGGAEFEVALRVYDRHGNHDQTRNSPFKLVGLDYDKQSLAGENISSIGQQAVSADYSELALQGIPLSGAKVRIHGIDINSVERLEINGEPIQLSKERDFVVEYLLPRGKHKFDISSGAKGSEAFNESLEVDLETDYFFMVALADLTVGKNKVSGSVEPLLVDEHHYGGDIFVDGRLAFYLKGKVKGKYLVTAQMDTGTEDVSKLFDDFHRKDAESVFRRIDPDQYYLIYGDDSTLYDDTDSQGKIYIRAEWDKSHALWGNFNTAFSGAELAPFNRSLYGAQLVHRSISNTTLGDSRHELSAFASQAQTVLRHNEFLATGGSLYYLKDNDIVRGSEKASIEVRQNGSERVIEKIELVAGRDYEIDEFQGRLILTRPLLSVTSQVGPSIIRDEPLALENTYLVVDYEFVPDNFDSAEATAGARAKTWLSDHVAIGATWAHENRDADAYDIKGTDITLKKSDNTYIRAEIARSESSQTAGSFLSDDGGLNFSAFNSNSNAQSGVATSIEARLSANDFMSNVGDLQIGAWVKQREAGFSVANLDTGGDTLDTGAELLAQLGPRASLTARATLFERKRISRDTVSAVQIDVSPTDKLDLSTELRYVSEKQLATNEPGTATQTATLGAAKLAYDFTDQLNLYAIAQGTLTRSANYQPNGLVTIGSQLEVSDRLSLNAEYSNGHRGQGAVLGAELLMTDTYSLYGNVSSAIDSTRAESQSITFGQRKSLGRALKVYSEHQFTHEDSRQGASHTLGLDHAFNLYTSANLSLQTGRVEDNDGGLTDRDAVSVGVVFKRDAITASSRFEYRRDVGTALRTEQWVVTNRFVYRKSEPLRWQGKLNASITSDKIATAENARFVEAGLGFAYRPISHDRLNMLGRLTWLYDLPPESQSNETDQRALIASLEGLYDFTRHFSLGAKLAHRESQLRLLRDSGAWTANDASLAGIRLHYRVPFGVEAMLGYHWLASGESNSTRSGALLSVGRRVGDNLRFSIGYNFTNFDDNLANDSYDLRGWFFNLTGTF